MSGPFPGESIKRFLRNILAHPSARGLDIDDPLTTVQRRRIIEEKAFLKRVYRTWYEAVASALPSSSGPVLELGSGAGFPEEFIPGLLKSDLFPVPGLSLVMDGQAMPIRDHSLKGIVLVDVLHHLPKARLFFAEAARCLRIGGVAVMVEPWVTAWSRFVYAHFHHEPFQPNATEWEFPSGGPLSGANGAVPWMIFHRDRARFEAEFPQLSVKHVRPMMPFSYALSGGLSLRGLVPAGAFPVVRRIEEGLTPWMDYLAMFALIVLERRADATRGTEA